MMLLAVCVALCAAGGPAVATEEAAPPVSEPAVNATSLTADFRALLFQAHTRLNDTERYAMRGTLETVITGEEEPRTLSYPFALSKHGAYRYAMSVFREKNNSLVTRLLSPGRPGAAQLYLPRELNAMLLIARMEAQPEGLVAPALLVLYDFVELSKPERWLNMISDGHVIRSEDGSSATLRMTFTNYLSLRNVQLDMVVGGTETDSPLTGLRLDLTEALREMPGRGETEKTAGVVVEVRLDPWDAAAAPPPDEFAIPMPRQHYQSVGVADLFTVANSGLPVAQMATSGALPRSAGAAAQMIASGAIPLTPGAAASMISQFKSLPRTEQRRIIQELRNSSAGADLRNKARQMGLTEQDIREFRSLLEP